MAKIVLPVLALGASTPIIFFLGLAAVTFIELVEDGVPSILNRVGMRSLLPARLPILFSDFKLVVLIVSFFFTVPVLLRLPLLLSELILLGYRVLIYGWLLILLPT